MPDYFALLDEPRRPWLDPARLHEHFLALSARIHPDRAHGLDEAGRRAAHEQYTELNSAYQCLSQPRTRLKHLLELETGGAPGETQTIPAELMEAFVETGSVCRAADALLSDPARAGSPLLKARWYEKAVACADQLQSVQAGLQSRLDALDLELRRLDADWVRGQRGGDLARLEELYRLFGYYGRWTRQLGERAVQLTLG
jgi:curved DNA-binding protein CbpA